MRQLNPEHIDTLTPLINNSLYFEFLNIKLCKSSEGYSPIVL